jgi:hypothetical protein
MSSPETSYQLTVRLPFHSYLLSNLRETPFLAMKFSGTEFSLNFERLEKLDDVIIAVISWKSESDEVATNNNALAEKGIDFLNHVIYHARTFHLDTSNLTLVSPRTVRAVQLVIGHGPKTTAYDIEIQNEPPEYFAQYLEALNEPGAFDAFFDIVVDSEKGEPKALEINLLADAYHALFEGRYSESVINCLTAVEMRIFPLLLTWLTDKFHHKKPEAAEKVLIEMSTATKYELLFGSIASKYLKDDEQLLSDLKGINKLRNEIIHKGRRTKRTEATRCVNTAAKLLLMLHFGMNKNAVDENTAWRAKRDSEPPKVGADDDF